MRLGSSVFFLSSFVLGLFTVNSMIFLTLFCFDSNTLLQKKTQKNQKFSKSPKKHFFFSRYATLRYLTLHTSNRTQIPVFFFSPVLLRVPTIVTPLDSVSFHLSNGTSVQFEPNHHSDTTFFPFKFQLSSLLWFRFSFISQ